MGHDMYPAIWALVISSVFFSASGSPLSDFTLGTKGSPFKCNQQRNLWCGGNATTTAEGYLILTPNDRDKPDEYYFNTQGTALYTVPLQLLGDNGRWRSFSTFFRFRIEFGRFPGDGMAFVMFNASQWMRAPGDSLGVYSSSGQQGVKTLAIEFDTFPNKDFDVFNNYVGVDLETLKSKVSRNALDININLSGGEYIYTWIDYDAESTYLEVRIALQNDRPVQPFLVYEVKLLDIFGQKGTVFVGFSGSNGYCVCHNFCTIFDWSPVFD